MNCSYEQCAPINEAQCWSNIDWKAAKRYVGSLQARIVKAVKQGRKGKVKSLQWLLTHSFYAKALAVKQVTENKGRKRLVLMAKHGKVLLKNGEQSHRSNALDTRQVH